MQNDACVDQVQDYEAMSGNTDSQVHPEFEGCQPDHDIATVVSDIQRSQPQVAEETEKNTSDCDNKRITAKAG